MKKAILLCSLFSIVGMFAAESPNRKRLQQVLADTNQKFKESCSRLEQAKKRLLKTKAGLKYNIAQSSWSRNDIAKLETRRARLQKTREYREEYLPAQRDWSYYYTKKVCLIKAESAVNRLDKFGSEKEAMIAAINSVNEHYIFPTLYLPLPADANEPEEAKADLLRFIEINMSNSYWSYWEL